MSKDTQNTLNFIATKGEMNKKHQSHQYDKDLNHIFTLLQAMGTLVKKQLKDSIDALKDSKNISRESIILADKQVNAMELSIDDACIKLIAKRQPLAHDLRFIITALRVSSDLERIGDSVNKICHAYLDENVQGNLLLVNNIENLGSLAIKMLGDTLKALADFDLESLYAVYDQDEKINASFAEIIEIAKGKLAQINQEDKQQAEQQITNILDLLNAARSLERVGDRCQNICEFVYYYLTGLDPREGENPLS